ncbi:MAG: hypothetical protein J7576_09650, partial [Siphonobacter aquaeclarae]|nr:hypothetical protein [Siphonobacter aquaeclarae]
MKQLETLVVLWHRLPKKSKGRVIRAFCEQFGYSRATADATVNGRRQTAVSPEEIEFLDEKINSE